jgi:hypothetical protein
VSAPGDTREVKVSTERYGQIEARSGLGVETLSPLLLAIPRLVPMVTASEAKRLRTKLRGSE